MGLWCIRSQCFRARLVGEAASSVHTFSGSFAQICMQRACLEAATAMIGAPGVVACANRPCARVHTAHRLCWAWFVGCGVGIGVFSCFDGKNDL